jgi:hypothetical protein
VPRPVALNLHCEHSVGRGYCRDGQPRPLRLELAQKLACPTCAQRIDFASRSGRSRGNPLPYLCKLALRLLIRPAHLLQLALGLPPELSLLARKH